MKTKWIFAILPLLIASCGSGNNISDAYGNFEATEILTGAEVQGQVVKFSIVEGQHLKNNEVVGIIDSVPNYLRKLQLIAQTQATKAKLDQVHAQIQVLDEQKKTLLIDQARIKKLVASNAAPSKQLDDINGQVDVINSQIVSTKVQNIAINSEIQALQYQVAQVNDQLSKSLIRSPVDGTILEKYVEQGEIVVPGKVLFKIANLSVLRLRIYVSGAQLPNIKLGQKVSVFVDKSESENRKLEGTISWISQQAEFTPKIIQTKDERVNLVYAVKVDVVNDGSIKIGMPGEVKF
jgi:HlyD family secretion protein